MGELVTTVQAAALFNVSSRHVNDLCREGRLPSARKARSPAGGQRRWMLDPADLERYLREKGRPREGRTPDAWSPRCRPARDGQPTELQLEVLAGEPWHELLDMQMRPNGELWCKWDDGEQFTVRANGECDDYRYAWVGAAWWAHRRGQTIPEPCAG